MKYGHETVVDSISTYQFQTALDAAVVYILSLECMIAIYCGGQPSLGGGGGEGGSLKGIRFCAQRNGNKFVHNSMALGWRPNFPTVGLTGTELNAKGDYTMLN